MCRFEQCPIHMINVASEYKRPNGEILKPLMTNFALDWLAMYKHVDHHVETVDVKLLLLDTWSISLKIYIHIVVIYKGSYHMTVPNHIY